MKDFISILRTDRAREIAEYGNKGYRVDKDKYRLIDSICFETPSKMCFRVEVSKSEIYFLLQQAGTNLYFRIEELYKLLYSIAKQQGLYFVINALKMQLEESEDLDKFNYRGVDYLIKKTVRVKEGTVHLHNCEVDISYIALFTLLNLVQEKSNALFLWSKDTSDYKDGIIRLLIALFSAKDDSEVLLSKGWELSSDKTLFRQNLKNNLYLNSTREKQKYKYYLTENEYFDIVQ